MHEHPESEAPNPFLLGQIPGVIREDTGAYEHQVSEPEEALLRIKRNPEETATRANASETEMVKTIDYLQSSIDGLRANIEQLEVQRKELQSRNETLCNVNAELQLRVEQTQQANDDLSNLIASTDIATLFLDRQMRIQRYTPHVIDIFNIIPADLGRPLAHITSRLDSVCLLDEVGRVLESEQPIEREERSLDGSDYIIRIRPYRTACDRVQGAVLTFFDISIRRKAEEALQVSEERFRTLADTAPVLIWQNDHEGNNLFVNQCFHDFVGPSGGDMSGAGWHAIVDPSEAEAYIQGYQEAVSRRSMFRNRVRLRRHDGQWRWFDNYAQPLFSPCGDYLGHVGASLDITDLTEAQQSMIDSEHRLRLAVDATDMGVYEWSVKEDSIEADGRTNALFGLDGGTRLGWSRIMKERIHPDDFDHYLNEVKRALRPGDGQLRATVRVLLPGGATRWLTMDAQTYPSDVEPNAIRVIGTVRDITRSQEAEDKLRESEVLLRTLLESHAQAIWQTDEHGNITVDSPSWRAYTGQTLEEWLGEGWANAVHTDDRTMALQKWRAGISAGEPQSAHFRLYSAAGTWRWTNILATPLRNPDGSVRKWVGMNIDIDTEKRSETALRESEQQQAFLLQLADVIRPLDAAAEIEGEVTRLLREHFAVGWCYYVEWDEAAARGVVLRDATRAGLASLAGSHDVSDVPEFLDILRKGRVLNIGDYANSDGLSTQLRARYITFGFRSMLVATLVKEGCLVASLIVGDTEVRDWSGQSERLMMEVAERTCTAIERGRAEQALRESEEKYRTLFERMDEGFALCELVRDDDGHAVDYRYVDLNNALVRHGGITPEALRGRCATEFFPDLDPWLMETYVQVVETGESVLDEHYFPHVDIWLRINAFPRGGNRFAVLYGNITERKRAEKELWVANERLKEGDQRKDEFLATLAHELRNPLAPISNALQILRHPNGRRRADGLLAMIERQVKQIVRLVDDLMEISRISRGKVDLRRAPVMLADILETAMETSLSEFERKHQQLTIESTEESFKLNADKIRLIQVFVNLLNNASKYTPAGGEAWISARRNNSDVMVTVRDTGMGIDKAQLPLIFELFSQPHGINGHTDTGLGIGLAMVRSLVTLHGGSVDARSDGPGQGSEFLVRLPLIDSPEANTCDDEYGAANSGTLLTGRHVLIVDDNRDAADSLCLLLTAHGADASTAYDGRSALQMMNGVQPHAIVLDIGMPGMDGCEVARHVRQNNNAHGMRLIALTGWGQQADRDRSHACGFDYHLTKPVDLDSLLRILVIP